MDIETIAAVGFMLFGMGTFIWMINFVSGDEDRRYDRRINQLREFGFEDIATRGKRLVRWQQYPH